VVTAAAISYAATSCVGRAAPLLAEVANGGEKLPPPTKAAAQMALIGIALVGLLFVVMILLGGHWVRRQGRPRRGPVVPPDRAPIKANPPQRPNDHDDDAPD
jgi:hypothetical protein